MHWKLCRVPGIYYLMQKCRAQTKGLIVLFSLPVIALDPGGHIDVLKWKVWKLWWSRRRRVVPETSAGSTWHFLWPLLQPCVAFWPAPEQGVYSPSTGTHTSLHTPNLSVTVLEVSSLEPPPPAPSPWVCA